MKKLTLALLLSAGLGLTACDGYYGSPHLHSTPFHFSNTAFGNSAHTDNRMAWETYRAVDRILAQAQSVSRGTPMLVGTINDIDYLETATTFGRVVQEQVSTRLTHRQYNVTELKLRNSLNIKQGLLNEDEAGEFMLSRDIEALRGEHRAAALITGTYAIAGKEVMVNLKLLDVATGKVIGATDYSVSLDSNTRRLIQSKGSKGITFYGQSMAYN